MTAIESQRTAHWIRVGKGVARCKVAMVHEARNSQLANEGTDGREGGGVEEAKSINFRALNDGTQRSG